MTPSLVRTCLAGLLLTSACAAQAQLALTAQLPKAPAPVMQLAQAPQAKPAAAVLPVPSRPAPAGESVRVLLVADRETTLSSPVTANIKMLYVSIGKPFAAGQTLVEFVCDEQVARLGMAKAELAGAVETHEAKIRMQGLQQASDVEIALAASATAKARAQVALQNAQVAQCSIKAPWSGRVAKVLVRTSMSVTPGQPMVEIVKSGPVKMKLNAPSRLIAKVQPGALFDVVIDETGKTYQAKVLAVNSRVDPVSQTIELEAVITKESKDLLPGMSGVAMLSGFQ